LGGVMVGLPFIEALQPKSAQAAGYPPYAIFVRQANGVQQDTGDEPERFWPYELGPLTQAGLAEQTDRALSVLSPYADRMLAVNGLNFAFDSSGCGHTGGSTQCLTAAKPIDQESGQDLADGESIDTLIARKLHPEGVEPLTLFSGRAAFLEGVGVISYRAPFQLRAPVTGAYNAYMDLFGLSNLSPEALEQLKAQRKSVNDLVRGGMQRLLSRTDLSKADRERLDLHFTAIRDLEVITSCQLPEADIAAMEAMGDGFHEHDNVIPLTKMQMDVIALACACGVARAVTLQIGPLGDDTEYTIFGERQYSYHWISHRIQGDGSEGAPIEAGDVLHHEIDKIHADMFKHLLDRLSAYDLGGTTLLDSGVAVWMNDMADKWHAYEGVPFICVGSCNGYLETGQHIDAGGVTHNKVLNTIASAVGCTKDDGSPIDNFGDPSLEGGLVDAMLA
jgi:hypothetical protein